MAQPTKPVMDPPARLQELTAQATAKYAVKDYNAAAELYAYATELQADMNGEMSSANADLLYAYGRCLYHVAVKKSDILDLSKVASEGHDASKTMGGNDGLKRRRPEEVDDVEKKMVEEEVVTRIVEDQGESSQAKEGTDESSKPYFRFSGDENFDESGDDQDGEEGEGNGEDAEEEDDFSTAYEVLDMARVLLQKRLGEFEEGSTRKGKETEKSSELRQLKERLADTYDLQAEISLEGERFPTAVDDLRSALDLKKALYPHENSLIAEAHYKLSLALEFTSVTQQKDENGEAMGEGNVDEGMREAAAHELEEAISSCKMRIRKEEAKLLSEATGKESKTKALETQIDDVKDMVKELSHRVGLPRKFKGVEPPLKIRSSRKFGSPQFQSTILGVQGLSTARIRSPAFSDPCWASRQRPRRRG